MSIHLFLIFPIEQILNGEYARNKTTTEKKRKTRKVVTNAAEFHHVFRLAYNMVVSLRLSPPQRSLCHKETGERGKGARGDILPFVPCALILLLAARASGRERVCGMLNT